MMPGHIESELSVSGTRMRFFRGGSGSSLVLLHGAAGLSSWSPFFQALSQHYDLIVPEHPGFGKSDDRPELDSMETLAEFYLGVFEALGLNKYHLIGSSIGGWLAAEIAVRSSSRLHSLTLIGPAGLRPREPMVRPLTTEEHTRRLVYDQSIADQMLVKITDEQRRIQDKNRQTVARLCGSQYCNPILERSLQKVHVPTLVVWGEEDAIVPVAHASLWQQALPLSQVFIQPQSGHLPHYEKPVAIAGAIVRFINQ